MKSKQNPLPFGNSGGLVFSKISFPFFYHGFFLQKKEQHGDHRKEGDCGGGGHRKWVQGGVSCGQREGEEEQEQPGGKKGEESINRAGEEIKVGGNAAFLQQNQILPDDRKAAESKQKGKEEKIYRLPVCKTADSAADFKESGKKGNLRLCKGQ